MERRRGRRGRKSSKKQKKGWKHQLWNLLFIVAIVVFCISGFQLLKILKGYQKGKSEYSKIRALAIETKKAEKNGEEEEVFSVRFDELKKVNPDTVGWIRFHPEPSVINYPIVKGKNNEEYLYKTFSANENTVGAIFMDVSNNAEFMDKNTLIYGHWMRDGSMFRHLEDYQKQEFWENNPFFYIYTPDGKVRTYQIYSCEIVKETSDTYRTMFDSQEAFQKFIADTKELSLYDTGIEVGEEKQVVSLSTCTSDGDENRIVVRGVLKSVE